MKLDHFEFSKDASKYLVSNSSKLEIEDTLVKFFLSKGYLLESGTKDKGVYGIGSDTKRALFGAFSKRYKIGVDITESNSVILITLLKINDGMNILTGGLAGVVQLNKEYKKITKEIEELLK
jgi:hypothetical protein